MNNKLISAFLIGVFILVILKFGYSPDNTQSSVATNPPDKKTTQYPELKNQKPLPNPPETVTNNNNTTSNKQIELNRETTIAGIYLGMPEQELQELNHAIKPSITTPFEEYKHYSFNDGLNVFLSLCQNNDRRNVYKVSDIKITTSKYQTKQGLTVGMSKEEIIKCYGEPSNQHTENNHTTLEYHNKTFGGALYFEIDNNQVVGFYATFLM